MSPGNLKKLVKSFNLQDYRLNQPVFDQGVPASYIYIVFSGEFQITRQQRSKSKNNTLTDENLKQCLGKTDNGQTILGKAKNLNNKCLRYEMRIATANVGSVIGLEDFLGGRNHTVSVRCSSFEGSLFVITGEELQQRLQKDQRTWDLLGGFAIEKD